MLTFSECKIEKLEKMFNLKSLPVKQMPVLEMWLKTSADILEHERIYLLALQSYLQEHVHTWNEQELAMHFIGPIFALVQFDYQRQFTLFAERSLEGSVNGILMGGRPDGMIATGYREPEQPYFCLQEYKKAKDPEGDPEAQVLAAMLVAQEINQHQMPVYGCFVRGRSWYFMALQGQEYATTDGYVATKAEIFDIETEIELIDLRITKLKE